MPEQSQAMSPLLESACPRRVAVLIAGSLSIPQFTIYDAIEFAEPHYDHCVRLCLNMFQPEALRTFRLLTNSSQPFPQV